MHLRRTGARDLGDLRFRLASSPAGEQLSRDTRSDCTEHNVRCKWARTGTHVKRVLLKARKATGVEILEHGTWHALRASREVILSSGAFNSPHWLMLSRIGDEAALQQHGIATRCTSLE